MTNRAYQEALSLTGLLSYDANSKILSTTFETLKFSKSDSNVTSSWRHQFSRSSKKRPFSVRDGHTLWQFLKIYFWNSIFENFGKFADVNIHAKKIFEILRKRNHAYSRIIFEWYGVVLEHISGSFHFQHDYNWRGILYFFSCQFWFFIFELVFEPFFEPKFHFYSSQVFHPFESSF